MARLNLEVGSNANDGTGDTLRDAMIKVNTNFTELYASPLIASGITVSGNEIRANRSNDDLVFSPSGTGSITFPAIRINDNNIEGIRSNEDINIIPAGTGSVQFGAIIFSGNNITGTRSNENINLIPAGTGSVVIGGIKFAGTSLSSDDSSIININEGLIVDGTASISGATTLTGAVTAASTLEVTGAATLSNNLTVAGTTTLTTTNIDNLNFYDNYITSDSNADINIQAGGTGKVKFAALGISGTTLNSDDSSKITFAEAVDVTGALTATSLNIASDGATVTGIKDEDGMDANSATKLATQQSIKAYVDAQVTAQDLDFQGDSGGALSIDLDSETLTVAGGTNITTTGAGNTITIALDSALSGLASVGVGSLTLAGNDITSSSNADINITPGGTGSIVITNLTIDSNINITDNTIKATASNSNLELSGSGSGQVVIAKADINSGTIDNTVIGGVTPLAGTFTALTSSGAVTIDSNININGNEIKTTVSNSNLELLGNGTGGVRVSGFTLPTSDGSSGQFIATNGLGVLSFATAGATLNYSDIADATTSVATSTTTVINTFAKASYRSAKYYISITDATNSRYEILEANVTHDGSNAFISTFGSTTNYTGGLATYTADINGSNVEVKVTNISADTCVFKFQRIAIDV